MSTRGAHERPAAPPRARIGRRLSDASPVSVAANGWPASTPISSRAVRAGVAGVERARRAPRGRPGRGPRPATRDRPRPGMR
ncbi:MAG: hypothetical protein MZV64_73380 [Ignavibacteriales bacterium]|nr:hypothetical protein [Ignavibacteriales bacterium]